jgi:hypothetical protein
MERERIPPAYLSNRCVRVEWAVSHSQSSIAERCVTPVSFHRAVKDRPALPEFPPPFSGQPDHAVRAVN